MAKSLRSKFKRKIRAISRAKKEPKTAALLEKAIERRTIFEEEEKQKEANSNTEAMEVGEPKPKATINVKTLRRADGSFPPWLSSNKKKAAAKKSRKSKKNGF